MKQLLAHSVLAFALVGPVGTAHAQNAAQYIQGGSGSHSNCPGTGLGYSFVNTHQSRPIAVNMVVETTVGIQSPTTSTYGTTIAPGQAWRTCSESPCGFVTTGCPTTKRYRVQSATFAN